MPQFILRKGKAPHPSPFDQNDLPPHCPNFLPIDAALSAPAYDDQEIGGRFPFRAKGDFIIL